MAYTGNTLMLISSGLAGKGQLWRYETADAAGDVDAAGYFADGGNRGMRVGDFVLVYNTGTKALTSHVVQTVSAVAPYPANVGEGTVIGSTNTGD